MAEQDRHLSEVQDLARGLQHPETAIDRRVRETRVRLREATAELHRHADALEESVAELTGSLPEPTAAIDLTQDQLEAVLSIMRCDDWTEEREAAEQAYAKFTQALAIESQPGGNFSTRGPDPQPREVESQ